MNYKKGISLVSLVVTIIVLVILIGIIVAVSLNTNLFGLTKETKTDAIIADIYDYGKSSKSALALSENITRDNIVDLFIEQVETENQDRDDARKYVVVASDTINKTVTLKKDDVEAVIDLKDVLDAVGDVTGIDKDSISSRYTISFIYKVNEKEQVKKMVLLRNQSLQDYLDNSGEFVPTEVTTWTPDIDYSSPTLNNIEYREYKRKLEKVVAHYDLSGGMLNGSPVVPSKEYFAGDTVEDVGIPSKEFHVFNGWNPSITEPIIESTTYVAQWSLVKYTFTFNLNGGNIGGSTANRTIIGEHGSPSSTPGSPVRTHYTFAGWDPGVPSTFDGNKTFTAQWNPVMFTFTFNLNGGSIGGSTANRTTTGMSGTQTSTPGIPTLKGHNFTSWTPSVPSIYSSNMTFVAQYTPIIYTYTFNLNGGTIGGSTSNRTTSGPYNTNTSTPGTPVKTHYTFSSWTPSVPAKYESNETFTAQYTPVTYTYTFNLNGGNIGGSTSARTTSGPYNTNTSTPANPVRTHYTFSNWGKSIPAKYIANESFTAQWTAVTYTYTFNLNGGTIGGSTSARTTSGLYNTNTSTPGTPVKTHYTFSNWGRTVPSKYESNESFTAQYTPVTYTFTFNLNGGNIGGSTANRTTSGPYGSTSSKPANPVLTHHTFNKWDKNIPTTFDGNKTFTAQYTPLTYTFTFKLNGGSIGGSTANRTTSGAYNTTSSTPGTPTRTGYIFEGWTPSVPGKFTGNSTYTAVWSRSMDLIMRKSTSSQKILIPVTLLSGSSAYVSINGTSYTAITEKNMEIDRPAIAANTDISVKIKGVIKYFDYLGTSQAFANQLYRIDDWGELSASRYRFAYSETPVAGCANLAGSLPTPTTAGFSGATTFSSAFLGCNKLTGSINANLFKNAPSVKNFRSTFFDCTGLTGSIPADLFSNNKIVTTFYGVFNGCSNLTGSIPANLFAASKGNVESFAYAFASCSKLTGSIPSTLFQGQTKVESFSSTFYKCTGLTNSIPANLFSACPVKHFYHTFYGCSGLTGAAPPLWNLPNIADKRGCFYGCIKLSNYYTDPIPPSWKKNE